MSEDNLEKDTQRIFNEIKALIKNENISASIGAISSAYMSIFAYHPNFKQSKKHFEISSHKLLKILEKYYEDGTKKSEFTFTI